MDDNELDRCRAEFERTGNGAHAWRAYQATRAAGEPTPEWVLACFDDVAARLDRLQVSPPRDFPEAVEEAVGVKRIHGDPRLAADWVMGELLRGAAKKGDLVKEAVKKFRVSGKPIWTALGRWWKEMRFVGGKKAKMQDRDRTGLAGEAKATCRLISLSFVAQVTARSCSHSTKPAYCSCPSLPTNGHSR